MRSLRWYRRQRRSACLHRNLPWVRAVYWQFIGNHGVCPTHGGRSGEAFCTGWKKMAAAPSIILRYPLKPSMPPCTRNRVSRLSLQSLLRRIRWQADGDIACLSCSRLDGGMLGMTRRFARSAKKEQPVSSLREGLPSALRFLLFCTLLLLFFSGILQLPIAARCGLTHLGAWFGDFPLLHLVHYSAAAVWLCALDITFILGSGPFASFFILYQQRFLCWRPWRAAFWCWRTVGRSSFPHLWLSCLILVICV